MFDQRIMQANISLASGNFASGGGNNLTLETFSQSAASGTLQNGLRMSAIITSTVGDTPNDLVLTIWGLTLSHMNQLTTLGTQTWQYNDNTIDLYAGTAKTQLNEVYKGKINEAYMDGTSQPQVCFRLKGSVSAGVNSVKPVSATTKQGTVPALPIFQQLAGQMGLQFQNNGVNANITNPYYAGNTWTKVRKLAFDTKTDVYIDRGMMYVAPAGQPTGDSGVVLQPPTTKGYPICRPNGLTVTAIWNPAYKPGNTVTVKSDIVPACGQWHVYKLTHELDTLLPHGKWFTTFDCTILGGSAQAPGSPPPSTSG